MLTLSLSLCLSVCLSLSLHFSLSLHLSLSLFKKIHCFHIIDREIKSCMQSSIVSIRNNIFAANEQTAVVPIIPDEENRWRQDGTDVTTTVQDTSAFLLIFC